MTEEMAQLKQQLAETMQHLEAQRVATYQAVEREHALKQENARLRREALKYEKENNDVRIQDPC